MRITSPFGTRVVQKEDGYLYTVRINQSNGLDKSNPVKK